MAANPPELKRDGTMQVTAREGAEFLKRTGAEDLVPDVDGEGDGKPDMKRDTTIDATVKEGEAFLEATGKPDETARTRGEQEQIDAAIAASEVPAIPRDNTMQVTAKEGQELLGEKALGSTRAETEAIKVAEGGDDDVVEDDDEDDDGDDDEENGDEEEGAEGDEQANLKRTITMTETIAEGEEFIKRQKTNGDATEEAPQTETAS